ncbi:Uncharacterized protein YR821_1441 [Yersinia ruckeri]|uniref:Uncharacterized protein n=1 Tax=Yersinia ruckeri TaxID=29486 RepID=A0A0A8VH53_YERRU|nr:Uncharacterized protein YR821_1441 [Yersinia ruckeri]CEK27269.1 hypothetical protein CSF007_7565 [Yersinia ruckeri]
MTFPSTKQTTSLGVSDVRVVLGSLIHVMSSDNFYTNRFLFINYGLMD